MTALYKRRIQKVKSLLKEDGYKSALVLSAPPVNFKSGDTAYNYRPDSNLFYLTGCSGRNYSIFISSEKSSGVLVALPTDPHTLTWEGTPPNYRKLAKTLGLEYREVKDVAAEIRCLIHKHDCLYHQNSAGTHSWKVAREIQERPYFSRTNLPSCFSHADALMEELRLFKDAEEIKLIKHAARITNHALHEAIPFITPHASERDVANTIDYLFRVQGGEPSFSTIVATGPSAAILHHEEQTRRLKNGEMLLIDCGAAYENYAADITRVVPVSGHFNSSQKEIYSIVLEAQSAAINAVRPGTNIKKVYEAAAKVIIQGLVELGVLRGKTSALLSKGAHKPYFMHGIGHTLGLDVHDLGNLRDRGEGILQPGMVLTIEPGLYFAKKTKHIAPCGVRIEDDVLVKRGRCEILTNGFPKEISEIEDIMNLG